MKRLCLILAAVVAVTAASVTAASADGPMAAAAFAVGPNTTVEAIEIHDLDLHDGTIQQWNGTYYMYGTMYSCGFNWPTPSPWCGFGVSTAPALDGPWSQPQLLFSPTDVSPFRNQTWQQLCGGTGLGCFNPRMIQRDYGPQADGVYILWFNAVADNTQLGANAYYAMGCNSPVGGCGMGAGAPYGSTHKPALYICGGAGDFSIVRDETDWPYIACTVGQSLSIERLDEWGANGLNSGAADLGFLVDVESPGIYQDPATDTWIMTYSDPNCGYCAGTATSYATASSIVGEWDVPGNTGWSAPRTGRRVIAATSCGGQARTVFEADGQAYQWVDLWVPGGNQTDAGIFLVPLIYTPSISPSGGVLHPQFAQWPCA